MPLLPVKNKEIILHETLHGPILWMGFNYLKASKPLRGDSLLFTTQLGLLDWETSTLTTTIIWKRYVKCKCPVFINIKKTLHYKVAIE